MCPPINEIIYVSSVNQRILVCRWHLSISLIIISLGYGSEVVVQKIDHPGLETWWFQDDDDEMVDKNAPKLQVWNARHIEVESGLFENLLHA